MVTTLIFGLDKTRIFIFVILYVFLVLYMIFSLYFLVVLVFCFLENRKKNVFYPLSLVHSSMLSPFYREIGFFLLEKPKKNSMKNIGKKLG
jgi:hypothetical protein